MMFTIIDHWKITAFDNTEMEREFITIDNDGLKRSFITIYSCCFCSNTFRDKTR